MQNPHSGVFRCISAFKYATPASRLSVFLCISVSRHAVPAFQCISTAFQCVSVYSSVFRYLYGPVSPHLQILNLTSTNLYITAIWQNTWDKTPLNKLTEIAPIVNEPVFI